MLAGGCATAGKSSSEQHLKQTRCGQNAELEGLRRKCLLPTSCSRALNEESAGLRGGSGMCTGIRSGVASRVAPRSPLFPAGCRAAPCDCDCLQGHKCTSAQRKRPRAFCARTGRPVGQAGRPAPWLSPVVHRHSSKLKKTKPPCYGWAGVRGKTVMSILHTKLPHFRGL